MVPLLGFSGLGYAYERKPATAHIRCRSQESDVTPLLGRALAAANNALDREPSVHVVNSVSLLTAAKEGCSLYKCNRTLPSAP